MVFDEKLRWISCVLKFLDMKKLEECVRSVQKDGLVWGTCKSIGQLLFCSNIQPFSDSDVILMSSSIYVVWWMWLRYIVFTAKLAPVGYGIKKLVITCVVEDDKIGTDDLEEAITEFEDYVSMYFLLVNRSFFASILLLIHSHFSNTEFLNVLDILNMLNCFYVMYIFMEFSQLFIL